MPDTPRNAAIDHLPPPDIYDPVVEAYKRDVDRTLLLENLKLTPPERAVKYQRFIESVTQIHGIALQPNKRG